MMDFMDVLVYESNGKMLGDDTSSYSSSMEALQCVICSTICIWTLVFKV
jgi:hypothetical protein